MINFLQYSLAIYRFFYIKKTLSNLQIQYLRNIKNQRIDRYVTELNSVARSSAVLLEWQTDLPL